MLRFPLRLTANLLAAGFARNADVAPGARAVQFVDAAELLHQDSSHPVSHEKIREIISSRSPVIWVGGSEPLHHPGISHLVRAMTHTGHFVFLETDGTLLRSRIHEFQPVSRLFLTVRLQPGAPGRSSKSVEASAWELATEGIRAARLSGFLVCVHARVDVETELEEMAKVVQFARLLDVDGMVISAANGELNSAHPDAAALQRKTVEARKLIRSTWWESFSRLIEPAVGGERNAAQGVEETVVRLEQQTHASEEGVKVA
jgi:MoaA/NifB/PqqE/SkfB family radical SAM enzyme